MGIFKAYDIRGIYPRELDENLAYRIGYACAKFIGDGPIAIGRDVRHSAPSTAKAVAEGVMSAGMAVVDIGLSTTPMLYFAVGNYRYRGGIMVTASHNPPEYIGMKICREDAIPIGEETGLKEIRRIAEECEIPQGRKAVDQYATKEIVEDYRRHILAFVGKCRPMKIVVDTANGAVGPFFLKVFGGLPSQFLPLYFEPDGAFPNHEPDPLKDKNIRTLCERVKAEKADLGIAFDGDGDRCMFVDERGERMPADAITAILAREVLSREKGRAIVYDVRSSWTVKEEIEKAGGVAVRERVGHAFMKATMRKHRAVLGGELSGHYYFADHFYADSGMVAFAKLLNYLSNDARRPSEIIREVKRYFATGEINFHVVDKDAKIDELSALYVKGRQDRIDGITVQFDDWWFNVRKSNTEPLLRLNLEAKTERLLGEKKMELFSRLGTPLD